MNACRNTRSKAYCWLMLASSLMLVGCEGAGEPRGTSARGIVVMRCAFDDSHGPKRVDLELDLRKNTARRLPSELPPDVRLYLPPESPGVVHLQQHEIGFLMTRGEFKVVHELEARHKLKRLKRTVTYRKDTGEPLPTTFARQPVAMP